MLRSEQHCDLKISTFCSLAFPAMRAHRLRFIRAAGKVEGYFIFLPVGEIAHKALLKGDYSPAKETDATTHHTWLLDLLPPPWAASSPQNFCSLLGAIKDNL